MTRFAQMDMYINQPRSNDEPGYVNDPLRRFRLECPDCRNNAIVNANVGDPVKGTRWVDHATPSEKQRSAHCHLRAEKNRLAVQFGPGGGDAAE